MFGNLSPQPVSVIARRGANLSLAAMSLLAYEMRNALAHGSQGGLEIVWKTIHNDLPGLAEQMGSISGKMK